MTTDLPTLAIIIPCRNEERFIASCLDSLLDSDYPHDRLELVVVDGMSTDKTRLIVTRYMEKHSCIRMLDNPATHKPAALNIGIGSTRSEVVMRIDAHSIYGRNYVTALASGLARHKADNIGGVRNTHPGESAWQHAIAELVSNPFAVGNAYWRTGVSKPREVDSVFCGCYRRDVFDRIGLFNESLIRTQDREFNIRLKKAGANPPPA